MPTTTSPSKATMRWWRGSAKNTSRQCGSTALSNTPGATRSSTAPSLDRRSRISISIVRRRSGRQRVRWNAGLGNDNRQDQPVLVEAKLVDADNPVVAIGLAERPPVVDDVPLVRRRRVQHGMVSRASGDSGILLENLSDSLEGSE